MTKTIEITKEKLKRKTILEQVIEKQFINKKGT